MKHNLILDTDSYKMAHFLGYPEGLTEMYSYMESRGGKYPQTLFFGLQPLLHRIAVGVTEQDVIEAEAFAKLHGEPFNKDGWMRIVDVHGGRLPVEIKAVPEGTLVDNHNVMLTIRNTDPNVPWLTSYLETMLLRIWYPITVATRIYYMKRKIRKFYEHTADNLDNLPFALLDFSSRGCSSHETSQIGGAAYLVHFLGSDNIPAVRYVNHHYDSLMSGYSVPATEHSIMCSYGNENELSSFENLIDNMVEPGGVLSVVSDTWDIFAACEKWCLLAKKIKEKNITLVVRSQSINPSVDNRLLDISRDAIESLCKENDDLKTSVVAFGSYHAVQFAEDMGYPKGYLHETHYDILKAAGARMDDYSRYTVPKDIKTIKTMRHAVMDGFEFSVIGDPSSDVLRYVRVENPDYDNEESYCDPYLVCTSEEFVG